MTNAINPIIISLKSDFPFETNPGLHGDMQFFQVSEDHQMTVSEPEFDDDTVSFHYECWDSDGGSVTISYKTTCGSPANSTSVSGWDVEISSGSDVWGLSETQTAIRDAIELHKALGRDEPYGK